MHSIAYLFKPSQIPGIKLPCLAFRAFNKTDSEKFVSDFYLSTFSLL